MSLLAGFMELALPSDSLRQLLRLVVGLLLLTVMLQPLEKVLAVESYLGLSDNLAAVAAAVPPAKPPGEIQEQKPFRDLYRKKLEHQLKLELAQRGFEGCLAEVQLSEAAGEPVIGQLKIHWTASPTAAEKVINDLAAAYNISRQVIEVSFD